MARDTQSIVKMSRREGYALHPKAHKALVKRTTCQASSQRPFPPGKGSQYSLQLREKQKVKRLYGLLEKQFSNLMKEAAARQGQSGAVLLQLLEQRADNAVYRAGFAPFTPRCPPAGDPRSLHAERHPCRHSFHPPQGRRRPDVRDHSKNTEYFKKLDDVSPAPSTTPEWLKVDRKKVEVQVTGLPRATTLNQISMNN
jgi:small subunit ribosomal protein S4